MSVLAFDTHKAVIALKQAGFAEGQAEAVVTTMGAALGGQVATKADLAEVRTALEAALGQLRLTTQADLAEVRTALEAAMEQLRLTTQADLTEVRTALEAALVAVKGDIEQLRSETKADIERLRSETKADLAAGRADLAEQFAALYKQLWLMAVGIVGLTVALLRLLP